jgi:hypothetical protein
MIPIWFRRLSGRVRYRVVDIGDKFYCEMGPEGLPWRDRPMYGRWVTLSTNWEFYGAADPTDPMFGRYVAFFQNQVTAIKALYLAIGQRTYPSIPVITGIAPAPASTPGFPDGAGIR